ncbi:MAG: VirB8/TrbF family protein, partial [Pseudomonadota bacterium]
VASAAGGLSLILATALVLVLPLRETQVFTVLVDRQTGDAENILQVAPTGIEDHEALKQSLLVAYVSDREGYFLAGIQARCGLTSDPARSYIRHGNNSFCAEG